MKIISKDESISKPSAVALGLFDGVHLGHQAVIGKAIDYKQQALNPIVFTFSVGSMMQKKGRELFYIFDDKTKLEIFRQMGVDYVCTPKFDEMKNMPAEEFARIIIKGKLNAQKVVCGHNFHFGRGGVYGFEELYSLGKKYGFDVDGVDRVMYNGMPVSSAYIRESIKTGDIERANKFLGRNYFIEGTVSYGNQIGRTINFPTINQYFQPRQLVPRFGVYASKTIIDGVSYKSVTNIGVKPTVERQKNPLAETHIMGISKDLYGVRIRVELLGYIRGEHRFNNLNELKQRIAKDVSIAKEFELNE